MRPVHRTSISLYPTFLLFLAIVTVALPGCGGEEAALTAPTGLDAVVSSSPDLAAAAPGETRGAHNEYPLEAGNWWDYEGSLTFMVEGEMPETDLFTREHRIWGVEELFGREYVVEKRTIDIGTAQGPSLSWIRNRQDKTGLYEADYPITVPPAGWNPEGAEATASVSWRAAIDRICLPGHPGVDERNMKAFIEARERLLAKMEAVERLRATTQLSVRAGRKDGGVLEDEITRLAYPLRPGQEWVIRDDPFFGAMVTEREKVEAPAGTFSCFRIKISSAMFGNDDTVYQWFGKEGLIGMFAHLESEMVDPSGISLGHLISEEEYFLSAFGSSFEGDGETAAATFDADRLDKGMNFSE